MAEFENNIVRELHSGKRTSSSRWTSIQGNIPSELPGFYYDPDKNRYFPTKGRIPGAANRPPRPPPPPAEPSPPPTERRKRARQSELLHAREMYGGGVIFSKNNKSTFKQQCQYTQASQPMVLIRASLLLQLSLSFRAIYADTIALLGRFGSTKAQP
ncbi:unnamed protein product [Triticum turgidum subsp. durum]|uniref:Uncharacterized protein n=1 Tax=Triticum turgidum subsp. durum TaxID=4567 RepID=A0A9R1NTR1_TRITD|nr:unnamed protein product [Triticum turgidum subsp. durum]